METSGREVHPPRAVRGRQSGLRRDRPTADAPPRRSDQPPVPVGELFQYLDRCGCGPLPLRWRFRPTSRRRADLTAVTLDVGDRQRAREVPVPSPPAGEGRRVPLGQSVGANARVPVVSVRALRIGLRVRGCVQLRHAGSRRSSASRGGIRGLLAGSHRSPLSRRCDRGRPHRLRNRSGGRLAPTPAPQPPVVAASRPVHPSSLAGNRSALVGGGRSTRAVRPTEREEEHGQPGDDEDCGGDDVARPVDTELDP